MEILPAPNTLYLGLENTHRCVHNIYVGIGHTFYYMHIFFKDFFPTDISFPCQDWSSLPNWGGRDPKPVSSFLKSHVTRQKGGECGEAGEMPFSRLQTQGSLTNASPGLREAPGTASPGSRKAPSKISVPSLREPGGHGEKRAGLRAMAGSWAFFSANLPLVPMLPSTTHSH